MGRAISKSVLATATSLLLAGTVSAQTNDDKQITIFVGSPPGSGYDLPARVVARHISKHLPGNPSPVVRNMPGANSIVLANYMTARAPKNGTEIAIVHNTVVIDAVQGSEAVRFKPDDLVWLGSTSPLTNTCVVWHTAPARDIAGARKTELRIGATSSTDATAIVPKFLNAFIGTKFKVTHGYTGTGMIYNALERGEADGVCAAWDSIQYWRRDGLKSPDIKVLLQVGADPDPLLDNVPFVMDLANSPSDKETLRFLTSRQAFARPFLAPPGITTERAAVLRKAFMATMNDPEFRADAKKAGIPVQPADGATVQAMVAELMKTPKDVIDRAQNATQ
jgi:tripartite-type tricarboxylate transporter receptor subunit TctC